MRLKLLFTIQRLTLNMSKMFTKGYRHIPLRSTVNNLLLDNSTLFIFSSLEYNNYPQQFSTSISAASGSNTAIAAPSLPSMSSTISTTNLTGNIHSFQQHQQSLIQKKKLVGKVNRSNFLPMSISPGLSRNDEVYMYIFFI